jgi:uncharacterized phage protein (TIGR02218 family)
MKLLTPAFRATASGDTNQPIELYDILLDSMTLHLVNYDKNISFFDINGNITVYTGFPASRESYERTMENPINTLVISVVNVDRSISAYVASNEFRGRRIVIRKVFADQLTASGDCAIIFDGVMDSPAASEAVVQITAVDRIGTLRKQAPRDWYQLLCNHKFGDEYCFYSRSSGDMYDTKRYRAIDGCTSTTVRISSSSGDDHWKDGDIQITSGQDALRTRKIVDSSGDWVKVDKAFDYIVSSGDTITIRRGCDKSHFKCSGDFNNDANFLGFDTIPQTMVVR